MNHHSLPLPLKMFSKVSNAGDQFNLAIAESYLNVPIQPCAAPILPQPHLMLLGSILQWADAQTIVCGAGFVSADAGLHALPRAVLLVRGPLSAAALERLGGPPAQMLQLADPGVLAARLFPATTTADIPFAVIPHYVDQQEPALAQVADDGGVLIDPLQPLPRYFELLQRSQVVLSSTLHGLIFAHAYGKPALWLEFGDRVLGSGFKFHDYYQSLGVPPESVPYCRVSPAQRLSQLLPLARAHHNGHLMERAEEAISASRQLWETYQ